MFKSKSTILFIGFIVLLTAKVVANPAAPSIQSITPSDESTEVARDANIVIEFDQPVFQGQGVNATLLLINNTANTSDKSLTPASSQITGWGTSTITIDYGTQLYDELSDYFVYSFNGFFENASNEIFDIPNETAIFTTTGIPPAVESLEPADAATNVSINLGSYVLTASEDLQIASSPGVAGFDYFIEIRYNGNTIIVKSFDVTDADDVEVAGDQITLKNIPQLLPGVTYTVRYYGFIGKPFEDLDGYKLPSFNNSTAFTFTTDGTPPVASNTSPSDESTFGSLGGGGNIVFNELVEYGEGSIALYEANGDLVESIPVSATNTDLRLELASSYIAKWNFDTDLEELTDYYILVEEGSYVDLNGNEFGGIGPGELDFTTNARPHISSLSPVDGASDVAIDAAITIDFDVDVYVNDPAELVIKNYNTDAIVEAFDLSTMGDLGSFENGTITLNPTQNLPASTRLYVVANPVGSIESSVNSENFLGLDDKDDWDFTTAAPDETAPEILSVTEIADGNYDNYTLQFTITFDEDIVVNSTTGYFKLGIISPAVTYNLVGDNLEITDNSITFTRAGLRNDWTYYIFIDPAAITDVAGNPFDGLDASDYPFLVSWDAPEVVSQVPMAAANQVVDTDIVLEFDENVKLNGAYPTDITAIRINNGSDNSVLESYQTGDITVNGSTLTISRSGELDLGSTYFIYVPTSLITATADTTRFFGGYISTSSWRFGTEYNFWNGASWKDGTPVAGDNITLKADYAFSEGEVLDAGFVYINDGVTLSIENNGTLRHSNRLYNYGDLIIESGASLNSQDNVTSYDDAQVTIRRNTTGGTSDGLYSFIGVPFYGVDFSTINGDFKYQYNQNTNGYTDASSVTNMIAGRGYTLANNDFIEVSGASPINGDVHIGVQKSSEITGFNLVSNPYTTAISYTALMDAEGPDGSGDITSTIYLWDDAGNSSKNQGEFITISSLGSVSGGSGRSSDFNGHIGVAQGFFVESTQTNTNLTFTDDMKVNGNNTDQSYFRTANENETIKLALTSDKGVYSEVLLGWREDALLGYDTRYDARKFVANDDSYLFMPSESKKLAIQGIPTNHDQPIPLGFYSSETSSYELKLVDQFSQNEVMLYDRFKQESHDLSRSSYSFDATEGMMPDRFELRANGAILSTDQISKPSLYVANSQLNMMNLVTDQEVPFQIITISGKMIKEGILTSPNLSVSIAELHAGVYLFISRDFKSKFIVE